MAFEEKKDEKEYTESMNIPEDEADLEVDPEAAAETEVAAEMEKEDSSIEKPTQKKRGRKARKKRGGEMSLDDDLEFITHESVRDKSKMAEGEVIEDEMISRKKTKRRSVDAEAAKKEKVQKVARSHWQMILIIVVAVIVALCLLSFAVKRHMAKKAAENQNQPISAQELEKDENEEINELVSSYYTCYAEGDTESILQYAYPMSDSEKSYIQMYSEYVDEYQNIVCYTKTGEDDSSYVVSASFYVKYEGVDTVAPGMDFFYVRTDDTGSLYIDNTYSPFNLLYQEYTLDQEVITLIQEYESGEDIIALQAGIQTNYETALEQDASLKTMVDETIANAVATWKTEYQAAEQQKTEEAAQQVQEEQTAAEEQAAAEAAAAAAAAAAQQEAEANAETENRAWMNVTETVYIRQEPNESSAVVASATAGSQVRQVATTNSGWSKVLTGDIVGYIKSEYLTAAQ